MPDPEPILTPRIDFGNNLSQPILQPGWTFETDGFGVIQSQCKFKWDLDSCKQGFNNPYFRRGSEHPLSSGYPQDKMAYVKLWKASYTTDKNGIATVTADYVGIDIDYPGVNQVDVNTYASYPQVTVSGNCSSEDITHHPNFIRQNTVTSGELGPALASYPTSNGFDPNPVTNPNLSAWRQSSRAAGVTAYYEFVDFLPNQDASGPVNAMAGVKSYFRGMPSLKVIVYYVGSNAGSGLEQAMKVVSLTGWVTDGSMFNLPQQILNLIVPGAYPGNFVYGNGWAEKVNRDFLITNVGVEQYGSTFKVTADLAVSGIAGWNKLIYPKYTPQQ